MQIAFVRVLTIASLAAVCASCSTPQYETKLENNSSAFPQQPLTWATRQSLDPAEEVVLQRYRQAGDLLKELCFDSAYEDYFAKTPCLPTTPTRSQLNDKTTITHEQKIAAQKAFAKIDQINADTRSIMRHSGLPRYIQAADNVAKIDQFVRDLQSDLLSGSITWAQYNQRRAQLARAAAGRLPKKKQMTH